MRGLRSNLKITKNGISSNNCLARSISLHFGNHPFYSIDEDLKTDVNDTFQEEYGIDKFYASLHAVISVIHFDCDNAYFKNMYWSMAINK